MAFFAAPFFASPFFNTGTATVVPTPINGFVLSPQAAGFALEPMPSGFTLEPE